MYDVQLLTLNIPVVPVTFWWLIRFSTMENLIGFKSEGTYQNSFSGNFNELKIFTYQSSSNIESGNQVHVKYTAPSSYEILTATIFLER